eukprot:2891268-Rhodomonas_salina.2
MPVRTITPCRCVKYSNSSSGTAGSDTRSRTVCGPCWYVPGLIRNSRITFVPVRAFGVAYTLWLAYAKEGLTKTNSRGRKAAVASACTRPSRNFTCILHVLSGVATFSMSREPTTSPCGVSSPHFSRYPSETMFERKSNFVP